MDTAFVRIKNVLRILTGMFFAFSGASKMWDLYAFSQVISSYHFLSQPFLALVSIMIPLLEFILGLMVAFDQHLRGTSIFLVGMVLVFTTLSGARYFESNRPDCGCFGNLLKREIGWGYFLQNAVLIAMLVLMSSTARQRKPE